MVWNDLKLLTGTRYPVRCLRSRRIPLGFGVCMKLCAVLFHKTCPSQHTLFVYTLHCTAEDYWSTVCFEQEYAECACAVRSLLPSGLLLLNVSAPAGCIASLLYPGFVRLRRSLLIYRLSRLSHASRFLPSTTQRHGRAWVKADLFEPVF
jgi:hypothetical protein